MPPADTPVYKIVDAISALRASASGAMDDMGVYSGGKRGAFQLAPSNENALPFIRSASQVLSIVYLGGMGKGGFFPNGMNGIIN